MKNRLQGCRLEAVLTHRVSAGYSDVEWLVVDAQCLLRDIVQRG